MRKPTPVPSLAGGDRPLEPAAAAGQSSLASSQASKQAAPSPHGPSQPREEEEEEGQSPFAHRWRRPEPARLASSGRRASAPAA